MADHSFGPHQEVLLSWQEPRIAVIALNRAHKRNACNRHAWQGIAAALAAAHNGHTRLAVLTGAGGHFSAGDDIVDAVRARNEEGQACAYAAWIEGAFEALVAAPFPVIAAISGHCVGGAVSLAMCCDFRLATRTAQFSIPAAKLGFSYPYWQCARLMSLVGISQARKMLFTGDTIPAEPAQTLGLVDGLSDDDVVQDAARFGAAMLDRAPLSIAASKRTFHALASSNLHAQMDALRALQQSIEQSQDLREGVAAFQEKRQPHFTGQ